MKRQIALILGAAFLLLGQEAVSASLDSFVAEALRHNDELASARALTRSAEAAAGVVGTLPDPVLALQYYLEPVETRTGPQEAAVSLSQRLPWPGKLSLAREKAQHQHAIVARRYDEVRLRVVRQVKETYVELTYNEQARRLSEEGVELLRYFESVALSRYSTGKLDFDKVLKIQVEMARIQERLQTLEDQRLSLLVQMNALLGAPPQMARHVSLPLPGIALAATSEQLNVLAKENSPQLQAATAAIAKSKSGLRLAEKDYYPDLALSVKTIVTGEAEVGDPADSGRDPVIAGLSLNIPLFRERRHSGVVQQEQEVQAATAQKNQLWRNLESGIEEGLYRYHAARRRQALYEKSIVPRVRQELEVGLQAFQDGRQSVLALLDTEKNLLEFELDQHRAEADQALAVARLEELVGVTLVDWRTGADTAATPIVK